MPSPTRSESLSQLRQKMIDQDVCPTLARQATQMVFGDGNEAAKIVFIGEAPGKNEDLTGLPFVGAAGKFLDEMLASIDLTRKDIYITNIIKYRPPNNRDPLDQEKKDFLPYLQQQLEIIQPQIVVTLGRHAANCFLPQLIISQEHGRAKRMTLKFSDRAYNIVLLPLFHPAAALYNRSMRQTLIDDFGQIPMILQLVNNYQSELINQ